MEVTDDTYGGKLVLSKSLKGKETILEIGLQ